MKNYLIEFLGTFFLTLAIAEVAPNPIGVGLVLLALVYIGRHLSGAYYNPALVIAGWRRGSLAQDKVIPYILAEVLGAFAALAFVYFAFRSTYMHPMAHEVHPLVVLSFEVLLAFALSLLYLSIGSMKENAHIAGIAFGLGFAGLSMLGGLFNPAVALGSIGVEGLLGGGFDRIHPWYVVVFVVGPLVGGFIAAYVFDYLHDK